MMRCDVILYFIISIGPGARSDWSKSHVLSEYETQKKRVLLFFATLPAARVFYISFVFSNARRVLSQCNTRVRLLYWLNIMLCYTI